MKNILTSAQTRETDRHTIETTPIASLDLMENAALAFATVFARLFPDKNTSVLVCCGTGNNGGDGLAVARLLQQRGYDALSVWVARFSDAETDDFGSNLARLYQTPIPITTFFPADKFPPIHQAVVVDALLGSGLNKPLAGDWLRLAQHVNGSNSQVVAIDIPSGLQTDGIIPDAGEAIQAHDVVTFQRPKLSFFFPESARAMDRFHMVDIGLDEAFIENLPSDFKLVEVSDIRQAYRQRKPFSHKGTYGHALIIAGSTGTMGAALLACGASLYTGAGLTTACIPSGGLPALNARYPEIMYCAREDTSQQWNRFDAVGIGPGLGHVGWDLPVLLRYNTSKPLVIDADALPILGEKATLMKKLPDGSILTPHMKEFDRMFGPQHSWWDRVQTARKQAVAYQLVIVLKNRYTFIVLPSGSVLVNPTGNPAMASGGMGDVLTGMLTAFLAQGYPSEDAAMMACYLHGAAGDELAAAGMAVVPATRLIDSLPSVIGKITARQPNEIKPFRKP